ncbi:hypothetical protein NPIL_58901 [Nephila pilipes]|uniref:Uncharacterized protein n=1 Tax=Nephila pilipes TaxID=299642 RepID=A0A8X6PUS3_NEPPI|nr:hypothetical protein NPIL_58901 [Nephila pilipes]
MDYLSRASLLNAKFRRADLIPRNILKSVDDVVLNEENESGSLQGFRNVTYQAEDNTRANSDFDNFRNNRAQRMKLFKPRFGSQSSTVQKTTSKNSAVRSEVRNVESENRKNVIKISTVKPKLYVTKRERNPITSRITTIRPQAKGVEPTERVSSFRGTFIRPKGFGIESGKRRHDGKVTTRQPKVHKLESENHKPLEQPSSRLTPLRSIETKFKGKLSQKQISSNEAVIVVPTKYNTKDLAAHATGEKSILTENTFPTTILPETKWKRFGNSKRQFKIPKAHTTTSSYSSMDIGSFELETTSTLEETFEQSVPLVTTNSPESNLHGKESIAIKSMPVTKLDSLVNSRKVKLNRNKFNNPKISHKHFFNTSQRFNQVAQEITSTSPTHITEDAIERTDEILGQSSHVINKKVRTSTSVPAIYSTESKHKKSSGRLSTSIPQISANSRLEAKYSSFNKRNQFPAGTGKLKVNTKSLINAKEKELESTETAHSLFISSENRRNGYRSGKRTIKKPVIRKRPATMSEHHSAKMIDTNRETMSPFTQEDERSISFKTTQTPIQVQSHYIKRIDKQSALDEDSDKTVDPKRPNLMRKRLRKPNLTSQDASLSTSKSFKKQYPRTEGSQPTYSVRDPADINNDDLVTASEGAKLLPKEEYETLVPLKQTQNPTNKQLSNLELVTDIAEPTVQSKERITLKKSLLKRRKFDGKPPKNKNPIAQKITDHLPTPNSEYILNTNEELISSSSNKQEQIIPFRATPDEADPQSLKIEENGNENAALEESGSAFNRNRNRDIQKRFNKISDSAINESSINSRLPKRRFVKKTSETQPERSLEVFTKADPKSESSFRNESGHSDIFITVQDPPHAEPEISSNDNENEYVLSDSPLKPKKSKLKRRKFNKSNFKLQKGSENLHLSNNGNSSFQIANEDLLNINSDNLRTDLALNEQNIPIQGTQNLRNKISQEAEHENLSVSADSKTVSSKKETRFNRKKHNKISFILEDESSLSTRTSKRRVPVGQKYSQIQKINNKEGFVDRNEENIPSQGNELKQLQFSRPVQDTNNLPVQATKDTNKQGDEFGDFSNEFKRNKFIRKKFNKLKFSPENEASVSFTSSENLGHINPSIAINSEKNNKEEFESLNKEFASQEESEQEVILNSTSDPVDANLYESKDSHKENIISLESNISFNRKKNKFDRRRYNKSHLSSRNKPHSSSHLSKHRNQIQTAIQKAVTMELQQNSHNIVNTNEEIVSSFRNEQEQSFTLEPKPSLTSVQLYKEDLADKQNSDSRKSNVSNTRKKKRINRKRFNKGNLTSEELSFRTQTNGKQNSHPKDITTPLPIPNTKDFVSADDEHIFSFRNESEQLVPFKTVEFPFNEQFYDVENVYNLNTTSVVPGDVFSEKRKHNQKKFNKPNALLENGSSQKTPKIEKEFFGAKSIEFDLDNENTNLFPGQKSTRLTSRPSNRKSSIRQNTALMESIHNASDRLDVPEIQSEVLISSRPSQFAFHSQVQDSSISNKKGSSSLVTSSQFHSNRSKESKQHRRKSTKSSSVHRTTFEAPVVKMQEGYFKSGGIKLSPPEELSASIAPFRGPQYPVNSELSLIDAVDNQTDRNEEVKMNLKQSYPPFSSDVSQLYGQNSYLPVEQIASEQINSNISNIPAEASEAIFSISKRPEELPFTYSSGKKPQWMKMHQTPGSFKERHSPFDSKFFSSPMEIISESPYLTFYHSSKSKPIGENNLPYQFSSTKYMQNAPKMYSSDIQDWPQIDSRIKTPSSNSQFKFKPDDILPYSKMNLKEASSSRGNYGSQKNGVKTSNQEYMHYPFKQIDVPVNALVPSNEAKYYFYSSAMKPNSTKQTSHSRHDFASFLSYSPEIDKEHNSSPFSKSTISSPFSKAFDSTKENGQYYHYAMNSGQKHTTEKKDRTNMYPTADDLYKTPEGETGILTLSARNISHESSSELHNIALQSSSLSDTLKEVQTEESINKNSNDLNNAVQIHNLAEAVDDIQEKSKGKMENLLKFNTNSIKLSNFKVKDSDFEHISYPLSSEKESITSNEKYFINSLSPFLEDSFSNYTSILKNSTEIPYLRDPHTISFFPGYFNDTVLESYQTSTENPFKEILQKTKNNLHFMNNETEMILVTVTEFPMDLITTSANFTQRNPGNLQETDNFEEVPVLKLHPVENPNSNSKSSDSSKVFLSESVVLKPTADEFQNPIILDGYDNSSNSTVLIPVNEEELNSDFSVVYSDYAKTTNEEKENYFAMAKINQLKSTINPKEYNTDKGNNEKGAITPPMLELVVQNSGAHDFISNIINVPVTVKLFNPKTQTYHSVLIKPDDNASQYSSPDAYTENSASTNALLDYTDNHPESEITESNNQNSTLILQESVVKITETDISPNDSNLSVIPSNGSLTLNASNNSLIDNYKAAKISPNSNEKLISMEDLKELLIQSLIEIQNLKIQDNKQETLGSPQELENEFIHSNKPFKSNSYLNAFSSTESFELGIRDTVSSTTEQITKNRFPPERKLVHVNNLKELLINSMKDGQNPQDENISKKTFGSPKQSENKFLPSSEPFRNSNYLDAFSSTESFELGNPNTGSSTSEQKIKSPFPPERKLVNIGDLKELLINSMKGGQNSNEENISQKPSTSLRESKDKLIYSNKPFKNNDHTDAFSSTESFRFKMPNTMLSTAPKMTENYPAPERKLVNVGGLREFLINNTKENYYSEYENNKQKTPLLPQLSESSLTNSNPSYGNKTYFNMFSPAVSFEFDTSQEISSGENQMFRLSSKPGVKSQNTKALNKNLSKNTDLLKNVSDKSKNPEKPVSHFNLEDKETYFDETASPFELDMFDTASSNKYELTALSPEQENKLININYLKDLLVKSMEEDSFDKDSKENEIDILNLQDDEIIDELSLLIDFFTPTTIPNYNLSDIQFSVSESVVMNPHLESNTDDENSLKTLPDSAQNTISKFDQQFQVNVPISQIVEKPLEKVLSIMETYHVLKPNASDDNKEYSVIPLKMESPTNFQPTTTDRPQHLIPLYLNINDHEAPEGNQKYTKSRRNNIKFKKNVLPSVEYDLEAIPEKLLLDTSFGAILFENVLNRSDIPIGTAKGETNAKYTDDFQWNDSETFNQYVLPNNLSDSYNGKRYYKSFIDGRANETNPVIAQISNYDEFLHFIRTNLSSNVSDLKPLVNYYQAFDSSFTSKKSLSQNINNRNPTQFTRLGLSPNGLESIPTNYYQVRGFDNGREMQRMGVENYNYSDVPQHHEISSAIDEQEDNDKHLQKFALQNFPSHFQQTQTGFEEQNGTDVSIANNIHNDSETTFFNEIQNNDFFRPDIENETNLSSSYPEPLTLRNVSQYVAQDATFGDSIQSIVKNGSQIADFTGGKISDNLHAQVTSPETYPSQMHFDAPTSTVLQENMENPIYDSHSAINYAESIPFDELDRRKKISTTPKLTSPDRFISLDYPDVTFLKSGIEQNRKLVSTAENRFPSVREEDGILSLNYYDDYLYPKFKATMAKYGRSL